MQQTEHDFPISVDVSEVRHTAARNELRNAVMKLSRSRTVDRDFWASFPLDAEHVPGRMLVVGDLARIVRKYRESDPKRWIASVRQAKPFFVALVRTRSDERYADLIDDLMRHSDLRIAVCKNDKRTEVNRCLSGAMSALDPDAVISVGYSPGRQHVWVEYGDGTAGFIDWNNMGLEDVLDDLILESATVGSQGGTVDFLTRGGEVFEIDAASIKALLSAEFAGVIAERALKSDEAIGVRVRSARLASGLSQAELGSKIDVDQAIISRLERGKHHPRIDSLRRIAKGLGLTLSELLVH